MSTKDIKDGLKELFPSEVFKRRCKAVDGLNYTHRGFESSKRKIVVTSDIDEDCCISNIVEVSSFPSSTDLKDQNRAWVPGGPLACFVYCVDQNKEYFCIWPKYIWDMHNCMGDGEEPHLYIEHMTGCFSEMESTFEFSVAADTVISKLQTLGAVEVNI